MTEPMDTGDVEEFLETLNDMHWWVFDRTCVGMGAQRQFDYTGEGSLGRDLSPRLGRCYELAGMAFVGWQKWTERLFATNSVPSPHIPAPVGLVHGSWHHREEEHRIGHAWVILADGRIWEPITGLICDPVLFRAYGRVIETVLYDEVLARRNMLRHGHFGPWHETDERGV